MADPIAWQVQQSLKTALETIDGTGDYFTTPASVNYRTPTTNNVAPNTITLWTQGVERSGESESSQMYDWWHTFVAAYRAVATDTDTPEEQLHKARADIEAALMADPMRGQLAHDTDMLGADYLIEEDARFEVQVRFRVRYRTSIANPTTQT